MAAFRIATGFVEVTAKVDRNEIRRAAALAGDDAGDSFTRAMGRRAAGDRNVGRRAARTFAASWTQELFRPNSELLRTMRTGVPSLLASPAGLAGLAVGANFVGSFATAVLGSAALLAVGTGLAALGGVAASGAEEMREAWSDAGQRIKERFHETGESLVPTFTEAADTVADYFDERIAPKLSSMFADLDPALDDLLEGALEAVDRFLGRIAPQTGDLAAFLGEVGRMLPQLGRSLGDFFAVLMDNAPTFIMAMRSIVDLLDLTLTILGPLIVSGAAMWNVWGLGISAANDSLDRFLVALQKVSRLVPDVGIAGELAAATYKTLGVEFDGAGDRAMRLRDNTTQADAAARNMHHTTEALSHSMQEGGRFVEGLAGAHVKARDEVERFTGAEKNADVATQHLNRSLTEGGHVVEGNTQAQATLAAATRRTGDAVLKAATNTSHWSDRMEHLPETTGASGVALEKLRARTDVMTSSMSEASFEAGSLKNALDILSGGALAARAAERQFQAAIDQVTASLEDNGATLDTNTDAGRANQEALDRIASAAMDTASATYENTRAIDGEAAAQDAATAKLMEGRKALIRSAKQMGLNADEARELADEILGVPEQWRTQFKTNADRAKKDVQALLREMTGIKDKTVTITTRHINQHITRQGGQTLFRHGGIRHAQQGLVNLGTSQMFGDAGRTLYGFAEPGTGGEAFIARNAPRQRSLGILDAAARWHRAVVVPMEKAATSAAAAASGGGGGGVTYVFQPGAITIDAAKLRSVDDLIRMVNDLESTARQYGAKVGTR